jgi:hypothetical protein
MSLSIVHSLFQRYTAGPSSAAQIYRTTTTRG